MAVKKKKATRIGFISEGKENTSKSYLEHLSALRSELSTDSTIPVTVMTSVENHVYTLQELLWPYSD